MEVEDVKVVNASIFTSTSDIFNTIYNLEIDIFKREF